jgi:exosortase E/protease (VPEID-CTERM system)
LSAPERALLEIPYFTRWLVRFSALLLLLGFELVALTLPFDTQAIPGRTSAYLAALLAVIDGARPVFITAIVAAIFLSRPVLRDELRRVLEDPQQSGGARALVWFGAHLAPLTVMALATVHRGSTRIPSASGAEGYTLFYLLILAPAALVTWALAALPGRFWIRWIRRSRAAFLAGAAFGWAAYLLGSYVQGLWQPVQRGTFAMVSLVLRMLGAPVIVHPDQFIIGTPTFLARIGPDCSGLEGIALIGAFLALYLWFYRRELRFPQALLLIPAGAAAMWLLNVVRIAALILIGTWDAGAAMRGFHSVAGWLFFNLVACGLIWASRRLGLFAAMPHSAPRPAPAAAYLAPMLAIIATSMFTVAFSNGFELFYGLRVIVAAAALWLYRAELRAICSKPSWFALLPGVLVFALWIALTPDSAAADAGFDRALRGLPALGAALWLLLRVAGAVATVPIAEELVFRGYATRKLIASEFETVPLGRFTWLSFLGSSILFGAMNRQWVAGTAAGMIFAIVLYRRGALSDAVLAHATSNGLLSAYVLSLHKWSLWG